MGEKPVALIYTLGCRVNTCESLSLADGLRARGFDVVFSERSAAPDVVFVNTCAVTAESARQSGQIVRRFRRKYPDALIMAAGCSVQAGAAYAEADVLCGSAGKEALAQVAAKYAHARPDRQLGFVTDVADEKLCASAAYTTNYLAKSHVKIEDGCDSRCSYCIIPSLRGHVRSKPLEALVSEISAHVAHGSREILLTGIEADAYGRDLGGVGLIDLLEAADRVPGIYLLRVGSLDPVIFTDEFIERLSRLSHFEEHLHLSVQSGSSAVLASMRRKYNAETLYARVAKIRDRLPSFELTADIIVGFPGETEDDFRMTADFARYAKFFHMHIFPYSEREGTDAASFAGKVPVEERRRRAAELEKINAACKLERLQNAVGTRTTVHFESKKGGLYTGYTRSFMPVRATFARDVRSSVLPVEVTGVDPVTMTLGVMEVVNDK